MKLQQNKEIQSDRARFYDSVAYLKNFISRGVNFGIDFILPPRCAISGDVVSAQGEITPESWSALEFITDPQCRLCGTPFDYKIDGEMECAHCLQYVPPYHKARSALVYNDYSRDLVLRFKHADQIQILHSFMPWVMRAGVDMIGESDVIIPVPLHRLRLLKRRYNQAALMAQYISNKTQTPWRYDVLLRRQATKSQGKMNSEERRKNVRKAFYVPPKKKEAIEGKSVLLIDDVFTTGATVEECTRTLLSAGAEKVSVLTIAKVVKR